MPNMFTLAGVSTLQGVVKARFANDIGRVKTLVKNGHSDIEFVELPEAMSKIDGINHLISIGFQSDVPASVEALTAARAKEQSKIDKANRVASGEATEAETTEAVAEAEEEAAEEAAEEAEA